MNYKLVLKVYAQLRQLTNDERQRVDELLNMSDSDRELLIATLGPPVKAKSTKPATKHFKKCDVCGVSRRAAKHRDTTLSDYHEFDEGGAAKGAGKRRGLPTTATTDNGDGLRAATTFCAKEDCGLNESSGIHDKSMGYEDYHEFVAPAPQAVG